MNRHYIYNCLLKNDVILLWMTSFFSVFHYLYFYDQEFLSSTVVLSSVLIASIGLIISMKLKIVINLYKTKILLMFIAIILACISAIKENTNDITNMFVIIICLLVIVFSGLTLKEIIFSKKIEQSAGAVSTPVSNMIISEVIGLYKLKTYEFIYIDEDSGKKNNLFFDYRLNLVINNNEMISVENGKVYCLLDFAEYCRVNNIDPFYLSKEDFEVYKMMTI